MAPSDPGWDAPWFQAVERANQTYGHHRGTPIDELPTPSLIVDRPTLFRNIDTMADFVARANTTLRPHTKVQKSPHIAHLQLAAGAVGVTAATVWEAAALAAAGISDILIANEIVGKPKITALASLAQHAKLTVVVDTSTNIDDLTDALGAAGTRASALIDIDVGMGRCGARSVADALQLARRVTQSPTLRLAGVQAYEGHCMRESDPTVRHRLATQAMDHAAEALHAINVEFPQATTLSGGGTGTYTSTGTHPHVTELQAGSYVFMDNMHLSLTTDFETSLTILGTVVARHGDTLILDVGRKSIGVDYTAPSLHGQSYHARGFAEEHAIFDVDEHCPASIGDRLTLVAGYAPTTVNLHDVMFIAEDELVVDIWPVFPRGPGHNGFWGSRS